MKRVWSAVLAALFILPSPAFAWGFRHPRTVVVKRTVVVRHGVDGGAIAAGVLGGLATGIILDRVLTAPAAPVVYSPPPVYYPPPPPSPAPRDPYDAGYSEGYREGVERGRYERYEQGRSRGYKDGYEDAKSGRTL